MSKIHSKNTGCEIILRKELYRHGFRFRIHYSIPGKPDIAFPSLKVAIFVNGCFWHSHGCRNSKLPGTHKKYWASKFLSTKQRDKKNIVELKKLGWKVIIVWECDLRNNLRKASEGLIETLNNQKSIALSADDFPKSKKRYTN